MNVRLRKIHYYIILFFPWIFLSFSLSYSTYNFIIIKLVDDRLSFLYGDQAIGNIIYSLIIFYC